MSSAAGRSTLVSIPARQLAAVLVPLDLAMLYILHATITVIFAAQLAR